MYLFRIKAGTWTYVRIDEGWQRVGRGLVEGWQRVGRGLAEGWQRVRRGLEEGW